MRSTLYLLAIVFLLLAPIGPAQAQGQGAEHEAKVERFISLIRLPEAIEQVNAVVMYFGIASFAGPYRELSSDAKEVIDLALVEAARTYQADKEVEAVFRYISDTLSTEDLTEIIAFFETPVGSRYAAGLHDIPIESSIFSTEEGDQIRAFLSTDAGMNLSEAMPGFQDVIRALVNSHRANFPAFTAALIETRLREAGHIE